MRLVEGLHIKRTLEELHQLEFASKFSDITLVFEDNQAHPYYKFLLTVIDPKLEDILQICPLSDVVFLPYLGIDDFFEHMATKCFNKKEEVIVEGFFDKQVETNFKMSANKEGHNDLKVKQTETKNIEITEGPMEITGKTEKKSKYPVPQKVLDRKQARREALSCKQCNHISTDFTRLETHIRLIHTNQVFSCHLCGLTTRIAGRLQLHIKLMHDNRKPFVCIEQTCDFIAKTKGKLDMHTRKEHTGEKFLCDQCDFKAWTNANIMHHRRSAHEGVKFQCNKCNASYTNKKSLRVHYEKHN